MKIAINPLRARQQYLYDEQQSLSTAIYVESLAKTLLSDRSPCHHPHLGNLFILKTLFVTVDGILGDLLAQFLNHYVPGLGIVTLILLVFITGLFAANFIGRQIVKLWEGGSIECRWCGESTPR